MSRATNLSIEALESGTGRPWSELLAAIDAFGGANKPHGEIVGFVQNLLDVENSGWWAQGVTVAYEQQIGRRQPGQSSTGEWRCTVSRTLAGTIDNAFDAWLRFAEGRTKFADSAAVGDPVVGSREGRWRRWRVDLEDGSRVNVDIDLKPPTPREQSAAIVKARLSVTHGRLSGADDRDARKTWWKGVIGQV